MSAPDKFAIARALREIAMLLELKGENPFRARAYDQGAQAVEGISDDIGRLIAENRLTNLRGVGQTLSSQIKELYRTGRCSYLEHLRSELPPGVIELSHIPGLSAKRVQSLHDALNISSIAELKLACESGKVRRVRGFGEKTELNILEGIRKYENRDERILLIDAHQILYKLQDFLQVPAIERLEVAGSLRRWQEAVRNINLVAMTNEASAVLDHFANFPLVVEAENRSDRRATVRLASGLRVHLLAVSQEEFVTALLHDTGSQSHYEKLQGIARRKGLVLGERGIARSDGRLIPLRSEIELYELLDLPYIPAELRENEGEIEEALQGDSFDDLIDLKDIQGMVHCHTTYSDGRNSMAEMGAAAKALGAGYITITDHSPTAYYAGAMSEARLLEQWQEMSSVQQNTDVVLLKGTESDILQDGSLDWPNQILEQMDVIIASIHSRMRMDEAEMTARLLNCMYNPHFKIWGHAFGRLVLRRDPIACRAHEVLDAIAQSSSAIEINGDPYRLDMPPYWAKQARRRGISFVISTDAHSTGDFRNLEYGVHLARRAGIRRKEVLNAMPVDQFKQIVNPRVKSKHQRSSLRR